MSQTRENCGGQRINSHACSPAGAVGGKSWLVFITLGVFCLVLVAVMTHVAPAAGEPASRITRAAALRQVQAGEAIYRIDNPVQLIETTVKLTPRSLEDADWQGRFLRETAIEPAGAGSVPTLLKALNEFGKTTVLHGGICLLSDEEPASVYSSKRVPAETTRMTGGQTASVVEYRDLSRRLTAHLEGIDAQGRICFSYSIELNYIEGEADSGSPAYASFNAEGRAKVKDGETLVIPNFDGSNGLLVLLMPRIMQ